MSHGDDGGDTTADLNMTADGVGCRLKDGMVFNLSVGLQDVPLSEDERRGSGAASMETFSIMIAG